MIFRTSDPDFLRKQIKQQAITTTEINNCTAERKLCQERKRKIPG